MADASVTQSSTPSSHGVAATVHHPLTPRQLEPAHNQPADQKLVRKDTAKVQSLRAAMRRGDADAPVSLANMYLEGKDVSRSCDQALTLLETAAAQPNARARNRLAALYAIGTCVQRDRVQAYRWLNSALAVDHNNSWAQQNLDQTWRQMTSQERSMAEAYR
jgi:TPR repeat protein